MTRQPARIGARRRRAQPLHAGRDARRRIRRAGGRHSARRVDSRGRPQRATATSWAWTRSPRWSASSVSSSPTSGSPNRCAPSAACVRLAPNARMILVGEPHPEFPLEPMIRSHGALGATCAMLGFAPIEDFVGYLGACDIVLNLRYPTVGESSGTLLRSLGLGKAVLVSEIGSFQEFPDDVCLKVPVGAGRRGPHLRVPQPAGFAAPEVAAGPWAAARANTWPGNATGPRWHGSYAAFLECRVLSVAPQWPSRPARRNRRAATPAERHTRAWTQYLEQLGRNRRSAAGIWKRTRRAWSKTLEITPPRRSVRPHSGDGRLPADHAGAAHPAGLRRGARLLLRQAGAHRPSRASPPPKARRFECDIDHFDAERDRFPYPDEYFSTVLCCELIEHLFEDPMHLMGEVNRDPQARRPPGAHHAQRGRPARHRRHSAGISSGVLSRLYPARGTGEVDARHNREYTPREIHQLARECRLRSGAPGNRRVPRRAASRVRLGAAPAGALPPGYRPARRRHLRRGPQDGPGARRYPGWLYS